MKATDCRVIGIWGGQFFVVELCLELFVCSSLQLDPPVPEDVGQEQRERATRGKILAPVPQVPNKKSTEFGGNKNLNGFIFAEDERTAAWHLRAYALLWEWGEALYPQEVLSYFSFFLQVYSQSLSNASATQCGVFEVISCERLPFEMQSHTGA